MNCLIVVKTVFHHSRKSCAYVSKRKAFTLNTNFVISLDRWLLNTE